MKLLLSFIDTISYLECGDSQGSFKLWLKSHADLSLAGVTEEEIWELRNSLLHMTNLDSRKVALGKSRRISFYVGALPKNIQVSDEEIHYFEFRSLINCIAQALENFCLMLKHDPNTFAEFISRYDRLISGVRYFDIIL